MDKKSVFFIIIVVFLLLIISFPLILSDDNSTDSSDSTTQSSVNSEQQQIDLGYECLKEKVEDKCEDLSLEEQIFSLLALSYDSGIKSECKSAILDNSYNQEEICWPDSGCSIKETAQAILALDRAGKNIDNAEEWLISQNMTSKDLNWYLQIDAKTTLTCEITYSGSTHTTNIDNEKKFTSNAGPCLQRAHEDYWLKIAPSCLEEEFKIRCTTQDGNHFISNLLYEKKGGGEIFVSSATHSASSGAETKEKVSSFCFKKGAVCDYEGTLWAVFVLEYLNPGDYNSMFTPYLSALSNENKRYFPDSFLFFITEDEDYYLEIAAKQYPAGYWQIGNNKFYDTSTALLSVNNLGYPEEDNAKKWLLESQDSDTGCWNNNNLRDTAYILYSAWPKQSTGNGIEITDCDDAGGYCMGLNECIDESGDELDYPCYGADEICCSKPITTKNCSEQGGVVCNSDSEECMGNELYDSSLSFGEICCESGCKDKPTTPDLTECEQNNGYCRTECGDNEEEKNYSCDSSVYKCCVEKKEKPFPWLIVLLAILIILVIIGIIFRKKLKILLFKFKSRFKKGPGPSSPQSPRPPGFPGTSFGPSRPNRPGQRQPPRGFPIRPPQRHLTPRRKTPGRPRSRINRKQPDELKSVLDKLKEMGK